MNIMASQEKVGKKVFVSGLFHETHTFLSQKTGMRDFRQIACYRGTEVVSRNKGNGSPMDGFISYAELQGWEIIPGIHMSASPGGMVENEAISYFERYFFDRLDLVVQEIDGIYLVLHGAMVSEQIGDVEGYLLEKIQKRLEVAGRKVPVVAVLDLHANVTSAMTSQSDCLYAYRKNPHTDAREAAVAACDVLQRLLDGMKVEQCYMHTGYIVPPSGLSTDLQPMKSLQQRAREIEKADGDIVCINIIGGYAYADIPDCGFSLTCCTQGPIFRAEAYLRELVALLEKNLVYAYPREYALDEALSLSEGRTDRERPILLIEPSDNIGAGAPGDGTGILKPLLERGYRNILAILNDPVSVTTCILTGESNEVILEIGGKTDKFHGAPVVFKGRVIRLSDGKFELENKNAHLASMGGVNIDMGPCAVIKNEQATVLLTSSKTPPMDLGQLHSQGIFPEEADMIIVKAAVSHKQAYDPIAFQSYYIDSPGLCTSNLKQLDYRYAGARISHD